MTRIDLRQRVSIEFDPKEGRTKQSLSEQTDINKIVGKFRTTGVVTHIQLGTPVYGDFSSGVQYHEAVEKVRSAQALFDSLPARIRHRVHNDPGELIAFVEDPANADELRELGLRKPVSAKPVDPVTPTPAVAEGNPPKETSKEVATS